MPQLSVGVSLLPSSGPGASELMPHLPLCSVGTVTHRGEWKRSSVEISASNIRYRDREKWPDTHLPWAAQRPPQGLAVQRLPKARLPQKVDTRPGGPLCPRGS